MDETVLSTPPSGIVGGSQRSRPLQGRTSGPTRRSTKGQWTAEEDEILRKEVERYKGKNWKKIAEAFKDRTDVQCLHRWQKVLNPELVKGPWSKEEDMMMIELVNKYGPKKWSAIAQHLPGRIGKQCRERWHNHLNPAINKESWTQEEELALIRAHQIYGNKWAELAKLLPGRSDNSIKNHWNSSVKKKLDSYIASGLLLQFPALPHPDGYLNQFGPSSMTQRSGDDTAPKGVAEAEELSDCSQGPTMIVRSHSAYDVRLHRREDLQCFEESAIGNELNCSPASTPGRYYSIEDVTLSIPNILPEAALSSNLQLPFSQENETCASHSHQLSGENLPDISLLGLGQQSLAFPSLTVDAGENHERHGTSFQPSLSDMITYSMGALGIDSDQLHQILTSDEECCRIIFSTEAVGHERFCSNPEGESSGFYGCPEMSSSQLDGHISATAGALSQPQDHSRLVSRSTSLGHSSTLVPPLSIDGRNVNFDGKHHQQPDEPPAAQEDFMNPHDGFICANNSPNSPHNDGTELGTVELVDLPKDQLKLVRVDTSDSISVAKETCPGKEGIPVTVEKEEPGSLCYEPPRFPCLDVPFFSCDLAHPSNDMQMDYSPLGIRQLMMSSMSCVSPLRLWDSPNRDGSPNAVLKSAGKSFGNAPSILRKRHRDLLSPLSDRRMDKKLELDITDFSHLDVTKSILFDEKTKEKESPPSSSNRTMKLGSLNDDDIENLNIGSEAGVDKADETAVLVETKKITDINRIDFVNQMKKGALDARTECKHKGRAADKSKPSAMAREVLGDHDLNDPLLFSPDIAGQRNDKAFTSSVGNPRKMRSKVKPTCLEPTDSSGNLCQPVTSPLVAKTAGSSKKIASASKFCLHTSTPLQVTVTNSSSESFSIFGGTPFWRSIESPSAWKSPWFMNSFLTGPRIETDTTMEDIGFYMSPGDRRYDALGLMKHVSEQNATVFANAEEVLGSITPKERSRNIGNLEVGDEKTDQLCSNVLIERRTLDFSECGSPVKSKDDKGKSSAMVSLSSPSSYLLKSCR